MAENGPETQFSLVNEIKKETISFVGSRKRNSLPRGGKNRPQTQFSLVNDILVAGTQFFIVSDPTRTVKSALGHKSTQPDQIVITNGRSGTFFGMVGFLEEFQIETLQIA